MSNKPSNTLAIEVLARDEHDHPLRIRYDGVEFVRRELDAAKSEYKADVKEIADDVRRDVKSGQLRSVREIERFVRESCEGSSRMTNPRSCAETLVHSDNRDYAEDEPALEARAYLAFVRDVYDDLGDLKELLEQPDGDEDDEHDTA